MKKLLYLGIVLMLASCGENEVVSDPSNESESATSNVNVDGREVSTIQIGNLEVMTEDLGAMTWDEAKMACKNLGDGWRLPTKDELNTLYQNKDKIGGFANFGYWSSTEVDNYDAWGTDFNVGFQFSSIKNAITYVRAVRYI